ncbi:MAG: tRNA uridine-5-carboxymethylaminomethyl(34) synthesis GTPase MnmE [Treponema sp.]|nr:tRNA uridine-5-carboxymethylaminomethyl(34) synthesis GTPase MnmE [Treponema sp.]MCL2236865.1 tRNA uridine-5-carboxymethylaminomethyl(34) synthesis GTPase MnmE [Treponema sp.]
MNYTDELPIAAFATTPANSALTLIRCSGKNSIELADCVFSNAKKTTLSEAAGNTVVHGWIVNKDEKIDEVLISVFRSPKSYTGEDSLDICCHGGSVAGKAVMNVLTNAGFRAALPGEFTFRSFMNGKIDLTRSESVMEIVSAKTDISRRHAISRLGGSLEKEINEIKNMLVRALAAAEIFLDYSEDEISADTDEKEGRLPSKEIVNEVLDRLKNLSRSWQVERIYQEGITLVIAGPPNSGKSSLFNSLLKEDRSIVTEVPGTTRDWIEAFVSIKGIPVRLIDTAGLRESDNSAEKIGVARSLKLLDEADLVLYLLNENENEKHECLSKYIYIWNKCDIAPLPNPFPIQNISPVCVSAKTGEGIAVLYDVIASAIFRQTAEFNEELSPVSLGTVRQKKLVDCACISLEEALALEEKEEPLDLIAPLLRDAVNSLGEITGEVSTADILEEMFSRFCVGK